MNSATPPSETDLRHLRQCIALAAEARAEGQHPFGSLIADANGIVLAVGKNQARPPEGDPTRHAEMVAVSQAARKYSPQQLATATLYTSTEPCCMCAGAIYWAGIGRIVYALSEHGLYQLTGANPENPTLALPCREVFARGQRRVEIIGPLLETEAVKPHEGFWV